MFVGNAHKYSRCGRPEKASSLMVVKEFAFRSLERQQTTREKRGVEGFKVSRFFFFLLHCLHIQTLLCLAKPTNNLA